ncbi:uncharacterized protein C1orf198 homolog [Hyperolius riggenbachi]|uniref:uncharacterized protein C1orf198 homolog n=1 Tax=Hyperolius riggenbachi TaxID=752182 RepID=UPI0035A2917C
MASMAAAVAAARTAVSCNVNRPLDEKERNRFAYFSSLNSMAKKIMQDKERIRQRYGAQWEKMPPKEQDEAIDKSLVEPELQKRYVLHREATDAQPTPCCYPALKVQSGQKVVHFGEEDITWQDEHSAPFSWETRSQMEFSIASLSAQEPATVPAQVETKQTPKPANQNNQVKTPLSNPQVKNAQGTRTASCEVSTPMRKEEESAFWKINMERSRIEGTQSEFHSLTPSQIKSLEKGEKPLPVYNRQDSFQKEKEASKEMEVLKEKLVSKPEKPDKSVILLTAQGAVITKQPKTTNPSIVHLSLENPRPSQSSVSTLDEVFLPEPQAPVEPVTSKEPENEEPLSTGPQLFSQINTSSMLLKSGFDFLDNWFEKM